MDRMGPSPILSVIHTVTIGTVFNFNSDNNGHGLNNVMYKQTFTNASRESVKSPSLAVKFRGRKWSVQLHDKINELQTGKILKRYEFTNSIYVHLHLFQQRHICKVIQVSK